MSQLRTEKHFLLNSVVNSQKKDEVIQILVDQLKYNAPRQYLIETAAHIRKIALNGDSDSASYRTRDKDIDRVCNMLEAPIDLVKTNSHSYLFDIFLSFYHFHHLLLCVCLFSVRRNYSSKTLSLSHSLSFRVMAIFILILISPMHAPLFLSFLCHGMMSSYP